MATSKGTATLERLRQSRSDLDGDQRLAGVGDDLQLLEVLARDRRRTGDVRGAFVGRRPPAGVLGAAVAADGDEAATQAARDAGHPHVELRPARVVGEL